MILIDLLPDEYRQKRRTPIKYMAAVMAAVALNGSLLAWWGWTAIGVAAEVKRASKRNRRRLASSVPSMGSATRIALKSMRHASP